MNSQTNSPLPELLETSRLTLREPAAADARALFEAYAQDVEVSRFMVWRPHADVAQTEAFVDNCIQGWNSGSRRPYVVAFRGSPALPIGMLEARLLGHAVDIGYVLARQHWGRGLMPEAVASLAAAVLADHRILRIQATCDVDNVASARTLEKAGFTREGRLDRFKIHPNLSAEPRPCFMYARTFHDPAPVGERGGLPRWSTSQNVRDEPRSNAYRASGSVQRSVADFDVSESAVAKRNS